MPLRIFNFDLADPLLVPSGLSGLFCRGSEGQLNLRRLYAMLVGCRWPISFTFAFIPPIRSRPVRSGSRSWSACAGPSGCRRSRSPIAASCSARSSSPRPAAPRGCNRSSAAINAVERANSEGGSRFGRALSEPDRIVQLVQSEAGYRNLLRLVSQSYLAGESPSEPSISLRDLTGASDGLLCLAGGSKGPAGRHDGAADDAGQLLSAMLSVGGTAATAGSAVSAGDGGQHTGRCSGRRGWALLPVAATGVAR
jgi:hypothetical protein